MFSFKSMSDLVGCCTHLLQPTKVHASGFHFLSSKLPSLFIFKIWLEIEDLWVVTLPFLLWCLNKTVNTFHNKGDRICAFFTLIFWWTLDVSLSFSHRCSHRFNPGMLLCYICWANNNLNFHGFFGFSAFIHFSNARWIDAGFKDEQATKDSFNLTI